MRRKVKGLLHQLYTLKKSFVEKRKSAGLQMLANRREFTVISVLYEIQTIKKLNAVKGKMLCVFFWCTAGAELQRACSPTRRWRRTGQKKQNKTNQKKVDK